MSDAIYPCDRCGVMRTKEQGGTIFTVCDECWDVLHPRTPEPTLASVTAERDALRADNERLREHVIATNKRMATMMARLAVVEPVFEAAKTWCETAYVGKPHPRFPAYPGDELLHAVNAALAAEKGRTP